MEGRWPKPRPATDVVRRHGTQRDAFLRDISHEMHTSEELEVSVTEDFFTEDETRDLYFACPMQHLRAHGS